MQHPLWLARGYAGHLIQLVQIIQVCSLGTTVIFLPTRYLSQQEKIQIIWVRSLGIGISSAIGAIASAIGAIGISSYVALVLQSFNHQEANYVWKLILKDYSRVHIPYIYRYIFIGSYILLLYLIKSH